MPNSQPEPLNLAVIGTYVPRKCGIATFTSDLCNSIKPHLNEGGDVFAVAISEKTGQYEYPPMVRFEIQQHVAADYRMAADYLNLSNADVVIIEHEFGIFGGDAGSYLNGLLGAIHKPLIITLHTLLENPTPPYRSSMDRLIQAAERLVVMSHRGGEMLRTFYNTPESKIAFIPHGIPDVPFMDPNFHKDDLHIAGRRAILTFGLLGPNKGIDTMIRAMPKILERYPDVIYIVLGATHPNVVQHSGEAYRESLMKLAGDLGVAENVSFVDKFVELEELCRYIGAADIYVTPYQNREQITSGTLAYSIGAGKAVVSTPYWYAEELLDEGRGRLVSFGSSDELAETIINLFEDEVERHAIRKRAYMHARNMVWSEVAKSYIVLAHEVIRHRYEKPRYLIHNRNHRPTYLPEIKLQHLRNLTDHVGIFRHAKYAIPIRKSGYTTEDNARAIVFLGKHWSLYEDRAILPMLNTYLGFLTEAYDEKSKRFKNVMGFDLKWTDESSPNETHGLVLRGLGSLIPESPNQTTLTLATRFFLDALPTTLSFEEPRAIAYSLEGIHYYLLRFQGDTEVRKNRQLLAARLMDKFTLRRPGWMWCDDEIKYAPGHIPHAILLAGQSIGNQQMIETGLSSLRWLLDIQTGEESQLSLIGNKGVYNGEEKPQFNQQPVDAASLQLACIEAYICTKDKFWVEEARRCFEWFLGRNDLNVPVYDFLTGGCRDGLHCTGANDNEGAEATLSWLIALAAMHQLKRQIEGAGERIPPAETMAAQWETEEVTADTSSSNGEGL